MDEGTLGGYCTHTLTDEESRISAENWPDYRFGKFVIDGETLAEWKAAIEKMCSVRGITCTEEIKKTLTSINGMLQ